MISLGRCLAKRTPASTGPHPRPPWQFSTLKMTTLESMQPLLRRFDEITATFQRKPYDVLNYRRQDFESDYVEFCRSIHQLEEDLLRYIDLCFENTQDTHQAIKLLKHFEAICSRTELQVLGAGLPCGGAVGAIGDDDASCAVVLSNSFFFFLEELQKYC